MMIHVFHYYPEKKLMIEKDILVQLDLIKLYSTTRLDAIIKWNLVMHYFDEWNGFELAQ